MVKPNFKGVNRDINVINAVLGHYIHDMYIPLMFGTRHSEIRTKDTYWSPTDQ